jgi:hypothetical protein
MEKLRFVQADHLNAVLPARSSFSLILALIWAIPAPLSKSIDTRLLDLLIERHTVISRDIEEDYKSIANIYVIEPKNEQLFQMSAVDWKPKKQC